MAPDWTQKCHHTPFHLSTLKFRASGSSTPFIEFSSDNTTLITRGRILDTVCQVDRIRNIPRNSLQEPLHIGTFPSPEGGDHPKMWMGPDLNGNAEHKWIKSYRRNVRDWVQNVMTIAFPDQMIDAEVFEKLWRTFVCNRTEKGDVPPVEWGVQFSRFVSSVKSMRPGNEWLEELLRSECRLDPNNVRAGKSRSIKMPNTEALEEFLEFANATGTWCYNRRFFKTEGGRFGWGPDGVDQFDVVAVLDGLGVPLLLRNRDEGFEVVGDCFAYGLMMAEGLNIEETSREVRLV